MNLNTKRLIAGVAVIASGTLFCFHNAKPEFREVTTFMWGSGTIIATLVQWVINGSDTP